jgi:hypothetical protein
MAQVAEHLPNQKKKSPLKSHSSTWAKNKYKVGVEEGSDSLIDDTFSKTNWSNTTQDLNSCLSSEKLTIAR